MKELFNRKNDPYMDIYAFLVLNKGEYFSVKDLSVCLQLDKKPVYSALRNLVERKLCDKSLDTDNAPYCYKYAFTNHCDRMED